MNTKGYTIVQVMMVTAMVLILSSVGVVSYQKAVQMGKESTCEANLKVLNGAVEAYVVENYAIPAVLGDLEQNHFEKAYAKVMNERTWLDRFTQRVARSKLTREAHAQFLTYENLKAYARDKKFFTCPSDENGGTSYGINDNIKGMLWTDIGDNIIIVGDCDTPTFDSISDLRARHGTGNLALAMTKGETLVKVEDGSVNSVASGDTPTIDPDEASNGDVDVAAATSDAQAIIDAIVDLSLPQGKENNLTEILDLAIAHLGNGDPTAALQSAYDFAAKVETDITNGVLTEAEGDPLRAMANGLVSTLGG